MGIVASLASAPVAVEIYKDELRYQHNKKEDMKYGHFQLGDADLRAIQNYTHKTSTNENTLNNNMASSAKDIITQPVPNRGIEKIYLTGIYKKKYEYLQSRSNSPVKGGQSAYLPNANRKTRSAYPTVRIS